MVPETGEGTSESTLSVAISSTVSSSSTRSPACFTHLRMVASMMLSPILGMVSSIFGMAVLFCLLGSRGLTGQR